MDDANWVRSPFIIHSVLWRMNLIYHLLRSGESLISKRGMSEDP